MKNYLFKNKFKKDSLRLKTWDYSWNGYYFVTICVKDRKKFWFGEIENGKMRLNVVGKLVKTELIKTEEIRKNVKLDCFVIMPNHIHGIIVINNDVSVETHCNASLREKGNFNKFGPQKNNLASIIRGFKGPVKRWCNKNNFESFQWQSRFYEHVIRTEKTLEKIRDYIQYNPDKWDADRNNPFSKKFKV